MAWRGILLIVALVAAGYFRYAGNFRRAPKPPPSLAYQLDRHWQDAHCPEGSAPLLDLITVADGRVADVQILDVPGSRLFVPRKWTSWTIHFAGMADNGVRVMTGGSGTFVPWLGPGAEVECRATVYHSIPGRDGRDPRFWLKLYAPPAKRPAPSHSVERLAPERDNARAGLTFIFYGGEDGDPDAAEQLKLPDISGDAAVEMLDDGWRVLHRPVFNRPDRIAYDLAAAERGEVPAKAVERLGWDLYFPLKPKIRARYSLAFKTPSSQWRGYGQRADAALKWFETPPPRRGTLPIIFPE